MSKFVKRSDHCYIVNNEKEFFEALYDYYDYNQETGYCKLEIRRKAINKPLSYPAEIIIVELLDQIDKVYIEEI